MRNSNTSRNENPIVWSGRWLLLPIALVCFTYSANGRSSRKAMSDYVHDRFGAEEGFPGGPVYAMAQTPDGYLWIGTEKGLVRFDGITFNLLRPLDPETGFSRPILGLVVDGEGSLWVRPQGPKLLRYREGKFQDMSTGLKLKETDITAMCAGKNGDVLFSGLVNGTVRYSKGRFDTLASVSVLPKLIISLAETDEGVWLGSKDAGLYYLRDGQVSTVTSGPPDSKINSLLAIGSGGLLIGTDNGIVRWNGAQFLPALVSDKREHTQGLAIVTDRDSNVWVGTARGLLRVYFPGESPANLQNLLPIGPVTSLLEDREGNLWIGTTHGIERLREPAFTTYSSAIGLPAPLDGPVYVDANRSTWVAPSSGGLYHLTDGKAKLISSDGLAKDVIYSISGGGDGLWLGRREGLTHLQYVGGLEVATTYTTSQGLPQNAVYAVYESRDGTVWAGTVNAGLSRFRNGHFMTYTAAAGLLSNSVASILEASDGTMWFGTPNGLNALAKGQWRNYTSKEGLPPGTVNSLSEDSTGTLWIGTSNGLAFLRAGNVHTLRDARESLTEPIYGIQEDRFGCVWVATTNHVLRVNSEAMLRGSLAESDIREYGPSDGLASTQAAKRYRSVVADGNARIWFSMYQGLSVVDPKPVALTSAPALVHVDGISADGRLINLTPQVQIRAPHQRVTLRYSGLSLTVPSRVRFRFRLDGFDQDWSEPTAVREAVYTNLESGPYRFHVIASNSEGIWNSGEATLPFEIEPVFWQTWWFRLSGILTVAIATLVFFRLRMLRLARQLNMRFDERLAERTRIAQELHDTLLQGFLSASMQLHVANDQIAPDSPAKPLVNRILELMASVIEEGRNSVRGLRSSRMNPPDLEKAFSLIRQEFPGHSRVDFRVIVEGAPKPLRAAIRDEVYLIGHEALSNAFRHSHAASIEVELEYAPQSLRVLVRDDGQGIDPQVLRSGRDGHYGLSGMKERTERIGGKLRVLSRAVAGTEIELSVPSNIAFLFRVDDRGGNWLSSFSKRKKASDDPPRSHEHESRRAETKESDE